ncbi:DUF4358 domain-containing protein [uncultured Flavonifractor sp.]|uniref:DUF4358 domain-containing protein n=1 Tax=uncultured Flavonifractor sp. TaxID=1193534 RepID=UPI0026228518|nr:DUF4358 domain-containing protein [uncultured Flavonifractor sp.]
MKWMLTLALALLLCACEAPDGGNTAAPEEYVTADQAARAVLDSQPDTAGLTPLTGSDRTDYLTAVCGVEEGGWTEAAVYAASGVDAREIIILRLSQTEDEETVAAALEAYRQARTGDFFGYAPDQAALLEQAVVTTLDGYAALLVCEQPRDALDALAAALGGEVLPDPEPTPTPLPEPALESTPVPTAAPTPDFDALNARYPFDPPEEHDMALYDTSAILEAWESGAEDGLSEKDAAILTCCRALFAEHVRDGMTDFEKELALHDAMVRLAEYDETVYDDGQGRPDNTNPYGLLVEGYGICLGYTASFQLLMDLADIQCITVTGAAYGSTSDHAWNMVRLEGEWYCVDPTWDDPIGGENVGPGRWEEIHHEFFNVTSDYMRQSDHQWDYAAVPEATATRFRWSGSGRLPR